MPRRVRIECEGAVYHVMARGNQRRANFRDDHDRKRFLETLAEAVQQFGVLVHAGCLMPNHYHLVVLTPHGTLSRALGWVQTTYTARFNARHRGAGSHRDYAGQRTPSEWLCLEWLGLWAGSKGEA